MNNLKKFKEFELNEQEIPLVKGGWNPIRDWLISKIIDETVKGIKWYFSDEEMERYGRRMLETGSPGGHK